MARDKAEELAGRLEKIHSDIDSLVKDYINEFRTWDDTAADLATINVKIEFLIAQIKYDAHVETKMRNSCSGCIHAEKWSFQEPCCECNGFSNYEEGGK